MIKRLRGTQDFLDLSLYNAVIEKIKEVLCVYNFAEIQTPIIEPLELYQHSLGEETDVVSKQMFIIESDTTEKMCLRPEGTASIVRAFSEAHIATTPWKVYTIGPMFRYERPQKGRYRQFHQVNIELIDAADIMQDVMVIKMLDRLFSQTFNLEGYALRLNFIGCPEDRSRYTKNLKVFLDTIINNSGNSDSDDVTDMLCKQCLHRKEKNILRIFDCKNPECQEIYQNAPRITENLCDICKTDWQEIQKQLQLLGVSFSHDPLLVRGLDYYSHTVFEFTSSVLGAQSAFCGGGRYNFLHTRLGGKTDYPSIGAAIGIERLLLLLESSENGFTIPAQPPLVCILPLTKTQRELALFVADELQEHAVRTEAFLSDASVKSLMRKANRLNARLVILIGETEQKEKTVTIKDMITADSTTISQADLLTTIQTILSSIITC